MFYNNKWTICDQEKVSNKHKKQVGLFLWERVSLFFTEEIIENITNLTYSEILFCKFLTLHDE